MVRNEGWGSMADGTAGTSGRMRARRAVLALATAVAMLLTMTPVGARTAAAATMDPQTYTSGTHTLEDVTITGGMGESAVTIDGTVTLVIKGAVTLTGGAAGFRKIDGRDKSHYGTAEYESLGAGAGIEVKAGAKLTLTGTGTLVATGGAAANGQDAVRPVSTKDLNYMFHQSYGMGGGGAGAGIGGRGAASASDSPGVGSISVADKDLLVQATGGAGGTQGGKGADGGDTYTSAYYESSSPTGFIQSRSGTQRGGRGGGGGGAAGYPASGIGSGGAAGGHGGMGGAGAATNWENLFVYTVFTVTDTIGRAHAGGGGGGGAGQGFAPGGGGGGGQGCNRTIRHIMGGARRDHTGYGKGGAAGADAAQADPFSTELKGQTVTAGNPGKADGSGGAAGTGRDDSGAGYAGYAGEQGGSRLVAGRVALSAGVVYAKAGHSSAQDIGAGSGNGDASSGSLVVTGGVLTTAGNGMPTPTDGSGALTAVEIAPSLYQHGVTAHVNVKVDGRDWGVGRFSPNRTDGRLTIWLPDGEHTAEVANNEFIYDMTYAIRVENGTATVTNQGADGIAVDVSKGKVTLGKDYYEQGGVRDSRYRAGSTRVRLTGTGDDTVVTLNEGSGEHLVTLQNASFSALQASVKPELGDAAPSVQVEVQGQRNHIGTINIAARKSNVTFTGDKDSRLDVGTIAGLQRGRYDETGYEEFYRYDYRYISEIAVSAGDSADEAKNALKSEGYTGFYSLAVSQTSRREEGLTDYDLNADAGGKYIYIGFKITTDPNQAIRGIYADYTKMNSLYGYSGDGAKYQAIRQLGDSNGDFNQGAGGSDIFLYTTKDRIAGKPISSLRVVGGSSVSESINDIDPTCYDSWVRRFWPSYDDSSDATGLSRLDFNRKAKGDYVFIIYGRKMPAETQYSDDGNYDAVIAPSVKTNITANDASQRAGTVIMDSDGKVDVDEIYADANAEHPDKANPDIRQVYDDDAYYTGSDKLVKEFWGTPSIQVNRGKLTLDTYLRGDNWYNYNWSVVPIIWPRYLHTYVEGKIYHSEWGSQPYKIINYYGSNTIGDVTVNGGTLQIGEDGKGSMAIPSTFRNVKNPTVTVEPGGNLIAGSVPYLASGLKKMEITGLPKDSFMQSIPSNLENGSIVGRTVTNDFHNFWTSEDGRLVTYVRDRNKGGSLAFEGMGTDGVDGYAYSYDIAVSGNAAKATPSTLTEGNKKDENALKNVDGTKKIHIHPRYLVHSDGVIHRNVDTATSWGNRQSIVYYWAGESAGIRLFDDVTVHLMPRGDGGLTVHGDAVGDGELQVGDSRFIVEGTIGTTAFDATASLVEATAITGRATIEGGSVKTERPLLSAVNQAGDPVYLAVIPEASPSKITVDDASYRVAGRTHGDGNTYAYITDGSRLVETTTMLYDAAFDQATSTFRLTAAIDGDGVIDLAAGDADILTERTSGVYYRQGGMLYRKTDGNARYHVTGEGAHRVRIADRTAKQGRGSVTITLDGAKADLSEAGGSPIDIGERVDATVALAGESTLVGGDGGSAIRVAGGDGSDTSAAASLTVCSDGILHATGGYGAAALGGGRDQASGDVTIKGGTLDLTGGDNPAIGAGRDAVEDGAASDATGRIVITGGSVRAVNPAGGDLFGVTPVNGEGVTLSRVVITPDDRSDGISAGEPIDAAGGVTVDGAAWNVNATHDDGRLYLYVPSGRHEVTAAAGDGANRRTWQIVPVAIRAAEHGRIALTRLDGNDAIALMDGDMLVEGARVRLDIEPDEGYGVKTGPAGGTYVARARGGTLELIPESGYGDTDLRRWNALIDGEGDASVDADALRFTRRIDTDGGTEADHADDVVNLGLTKAGDVAVALTASAIGGSGVQADVLVNGKVKETFTLDGTPGRHEYRWRASADQNVQMRFHGEGDVTVEALLLGGVVGVDALTAEFAPVVTVTLDQPAGGIDGGAGDGTGNTDSGGTDAGGTDVGNTDDGDTDSVDGGADEDGTDLYTGGVIEASADGGVTDRDPTRDGLQLFAGETLHIRYKPMEDGNVFDRFILTYEDGRRDMRETASFSLTVEQGRDVSVSVEAHREPHWTLSIPATVALGDEPTQTQASLAALGNMGEGDTLDVTVSGTGGDGRLPLERRGDQDPYAIATLVTKSDGSALAPGTPLLRYANNDAVTPIEGDGLITFAAPEGRRLAGEYHGTLTFITEYHRHGADG